MLTPEQQADQAAFDAAYPVPEFHAAARIRFLSVEADRDGVYWVFLQYPRNWVHAPWSARPHINGKNLELGIRMRFIDEYPVPPAGDYRFVDQFAVEKNPLLAPLLERVKTGDWPFWIGAVELPFRPDNVTIVDR